ncbi:MAG: OB-fold protein [Ginsengibacter sp.]
MVKKSRSIFLALIVVIVIIAIGGYVVWNKPHRDVKDAKGIKITAAELYQRLSHNDSMFHNTSPINHVVLVSGQVRQVQKNQKGQQLVLLKTNTDGASVNCTMEEKTNQPIEKGQTVSIKGICSGYIAGDEELQLPGDVYLIRCYLSSTK